MLLRLKLMIIFLILICAQVDGYSFKVYKRYYSFSTEFEIECSGCQLARAVKSLFHMRTQYDLYDQHGVLVSFAQHGVFPSYGLGWFYPWAADLYVYGADGTYIGSIDGVVYTEAPAKFNFYNQLGEPIATAYMDGDRRSFILYDCSAVEKRIGVLERHDLKFQVDYWTVTIEDDALLAEELVDMFAIFASDRQEQLK